MVNEKEYVLSFAKSFLEHAKDDISKIGECFFMLGLRLYEAQKYNYIEALGYESLEALAETELELGKSTAYNLIKIFERFCDRDEHGNYKAWINPRFRNYSYSKLVELSKAICLPYRIEDYIPPSTTVKDIREYIKYINKNPGSFAPLPVWKKGNELLGPLVEVVDTFSETINTAGEVVAEEVPSKDTSIDSCHFSKRLEKVAVEQLISEEELTSLFSDYCKMYDMQLHAYTKDGLWLRCVPSAFSQFFYGDLKKFLEQKIQLLLQN